MCGKPLDPRWKICPYCEAEVGQAAAEAPAAAAAARARPATAAVPPAGPPGPRRPRAPDGDAEAPASGNDRPRTERPARAARERPQ